MRNQLKCIGGFKSRFLSSFLPQSLLSDIRFWRYRVSHCRCLQFIGIFVLFSRPDLCVSECHNTVLLSDLRVQSSVESDYTLSCTLAQVLMWIEFG
jgi:hypothetical protein